jgi:hypothetical protein
MVEVVLRIKLSCSEATRHVKSCKDNPVIAYSSLIQTFTSREVLKIRYKQREVYFLLICL